MYVSLHSLLHLAITIFFQMVFMRDLENYIGWKRMAFIYFISGMGGNLASAIFVPFNVSYSRISGIICFEGSRSQNGSKISNYGKLAMMESVGGYQS